MRVDSRLRRGRHPSTCGLMASLAMWMPVSTPSTSGIVVEGFESESIDPPAGPGAFGVELSPDGGGVIATWIEPAAEGAVVHMSRFDPGVAIDAGDLEAIGTWSKPCVVTSGPELFANWADRPSVRRLADGSLLSHDLRKISEGTYAYGIRLQRSSDDGATWSDLGWLHDDARAVEHGFASIAATPGGVAAVWLDGRDMPAQTGDEHDHGHHGAGGAMTLRGAIFDPTVTSLETPPASIGLDARVCECCDTDLAWTSEGPIVVYRDRGPNEERDIAVVRRTGEGWSVPVPVHRDLWRIDACPVNGPAIVASGRQVVVTWYTAAPGDGDEPRPPRVLVAISDDAGDTFTTARVVSDSTIGRTDVVMLPDGDAVVAWVDMCEPPAGPFADLGLGRAIDADGERGSLALRRVQRDGSLGPVHRVASMHLGRRAGFPRLALLPADDRTGQGTRLLAAWRDEDADRLRAIVLTPPD